MLGYITHTDCALHDAGPGHPERPARLSAINDQVIASGLEPLLQHFEAPMVAREQLLRAHSQAWVDRVFAMAPSEGFVAIDADTVMSPATLVASQRAAGAGVLAVEKVCSGELSAGFCAVRPPGHHAEHDRGMGFCIFNSIAVAAAHALDACGLERVAVVDFDVHHGNGTEDIFRNEPRVLFCSSFQHPLYPYTGHASDTANLVGVPLPAGTDGAAFREAITTHWFGALDDFAPQLILISAGFDAHRLDELANLRLVEADYRWISDELVDIAKKHAGGRIVSMLEGGYDTGALARSVVQHLHALLG